MRILPGPTRKGVKELCAGAHFLIASTRMGKTLHTLALSYYLDSDYVYVNEPRSIVSPVLPTLYNLDGLMGRTELFAYLKTIPGKALCVDSLCDLFASESKKAAAMKGGLTHDQLTFCKRLNNACYNAGITLIGVINRELVPTAEAFEGVVEGVMTISIPGTLSFISREKRQSKKLVIPDENMQQACDDLGFGTFKKTQNDNVLTNSTLSTGKNCFRC